MVDLVQLLHRSVRAGGDYGRHAQALIQVGDAWGPTRGSSVGGAAKSGRFRPHDCICWGLQAASMDGPLNPATLQPFPCSSCT
jgi:hypothetical protein